MGGWVSNYWICIEQTCAHSSINGISRIPWEDITFEQLTQLLLYILSEPYQGSDGVSYPSYNAYGAAVTHPQQGGFNYDLWAGIKSMVKDLLANPGLPPNQAPIVLQYYGVTYTPLDAIQNNSAVMYYASGVRVNFPEPAGWVARDIFTVNGVEWIQWYGTQPINPP